MRKVNGVYVPSGTDIRHAEAKTRAIAKQRKGQYDGEVQCWFNEDSGKFSFDECDNHNSWRIDNGIRFICAATVFSWR